MFGRTYIVTIRGSRLFILSVYGTAVTDNLLCIGSGFTFHNMKTFFTANITEIEKWLQYTCSNQSLSEEEREQQLINWENAPAARYCHHRGEHLLPLHTCYSLTQSPVQRFATLIF